MEALLKMVEDVVLSIRKLAEQMSSATAVANNITKEADAKLKAASDSESRTDIKAKEISEREAKVSKIENIVAVEEEGRVLAKQNKDATEKLEQFALAFSKEKTDTLRDITHKIRALANDRTALENEYADLRKEQADFKIAQEKMRENILKELKALK